MFKTQYGDRVNVAYKNMMSKLEREAAPSEKPSDVVGRSIMIDARDARRSPEAVAYSSPITRDGQTELSGAPTGTRDMYKQAV